MRHRLRIALVLFAVISCAGINALPARADSTFTSPRASAEVQQTVHDVLADPEFRHLHDKRNEGDDWFNKDKFPKWLRDLLDWLFRDDRKPSEPTDSASLASLLYYLALTTLAAALGVLLVAIVRSVDQRTALNPSDFAGDGEAIEPTRPPGDIPANEYERRALEAAQAGNFRGALRELVLGAMSWTERAGLIRYRRGLTNRDYVRAIWRMVERRESLLQIVAAFERVFYGRRTADAATFEVCLSEFQKSFRTEATDAQPSN
ncbi:DUF4129 domain-containing protein [bacterium]|nr:DUF4129 domain-containing protein [bacterium]